MGNARLGRYTEVDYCKRTCSGSGSGGPGCPARSCPVRRTDRRQGDSTGIHKVEIATRVQLLPRVFVVHIDGRSCGTLVQADIAIGIVGERLHRSPRVNNKRARATSVKSKPISRFLISPVAAKMVRQLCAPSTKLEGFLKCCGIYSLGCVAGRGTPCSWQPLQV
jgi:hypothetical protein